MVVLPVVGSNQVAEDESASISPLVTRNTHHDTVPATSLAVDTARTTTTQIGANDEFLLQQEERINKRNVTETFAGVLDEVALANHPWKYQRTPNDDSNEEHINIAGVIPEFYPPGISLPDSPMILAPPHDESANFEVVPMESQPTTMEKAGDPKMVQPPRKYFCCW
jgi:hypothetical protein